MKNILLLLLVISTLLSAQGKITFSSVEKNWIKNHKKISIGIYKNIKPIEYMYHKEPNGIGWDYLTYVSKVTGIEFVAIEEESSKASAQALKSKKIFLVSAFKDIFTQEDFLYSTPYFYSKNSIILRSNELKNFSLLYLKEKQFASVSMYEYHENIERSYKNNLQFVKVATPLAALKLIQNYKSDFTVLPEAVAKYIISKEQLTQLSLINDGLEVSGVSFVAIKENEILISIINKVIESMSEIERFEVHKKWLSDIYDIYDSEKKARNTLTNEDKEYLRVHSIIRYSGDPQWLPYEAFTEDGRYIGITAEYLKKIEKFLNITFLKIKPKSWSDAVDMLKDGKIDILSETSQTPLRKDFLISNSYLANNIGIVMHKNQNIVNGISELEYKKIALIRDYGYNKQIKKVYPNIKFSYVNTTREGLEAVSDNSIDALICSYTMADYQINKFNISNAEIVGSTDFKMSLAFAVSPKLSSFLPILNKAIAQLDADDREKIIKKWIKDHSITHIDYTLAILITIFSITMFGIIIISYRKLKLENRKEKVIREELEILNTRFSSIANNMNGVIYECEVQEDNSLVPIYMSSGSLKIFDLTADDVTTNYSLLFDMIFPEDIDNFFSLLVDTIPGETREWQGRMILNGEVRWISNTFILQNKNNKQKMLDGFIVDITDDKENELDLLEQKQKAEIATNSKSEFLSNMSHEIRTPMNAIIGFAELLEMTSLDKKQKQFLGSIKTSSKNLLHLINEILDLSKIEAKKIVLNYEYIDITKMLFELENTFAKSCKEKSLKFKMDFGETLSGGVLLDELRLRQILFNLISNAVKFTHEGEVKIEVSWQKREEGLITLRIDVIDTGIGVSTSQIHKIFQNFEQQDGQDTRKYGGTGLGLSISKKLVELMNGSIKVKSVLGEGSTFSIEFENLKIGKLSHTIQMQKNYIFKSAKILIVEDVESNAQLLQEQLSSFSLESDLAENGAVALEMLESKSYDIVLMDINMPIMNGFEALKRIRKIETFKHLKVISVSAAVMQNEQENILKKGFDASISKPIEVENLQSVLAKFLEHEVVEKDVKVEKEEDSELNLSLLECQSLREKFADEIDIAERSGKFDIITKLSEKIRLFAHDNNISSLVTWTDEIEDALESFDIEKLEKLFRKLKTF